MRSAALSPAAPCARVALGSRRRPSPARSALGRTDRDRASRGDAYEVRRARAPVRVHRGSMSASRSRTRSCSGESLPIDMEGVAHRSSSHRQNSRDLPRYRSANPTGSRSRARSRTRTSSRLGLPHQLADEVRADLRIGIAQLRAERPRLTCRRPTRSTGARRHRSTDRSAWEQGRTRRDKDIRPIAPPQAWAGAGGGFSLLSQSLTARAVRRSGGWRATDTRPEEIREHYPAEWVACAPTPARSGGLGPPVRPLLRPHDHRAGADARRLRRREERDRVPLIRPAVSYFTS